VSSALDEQSAATPPPKRADTALLAKLALRGSAFALAGRGANEALRFGSNLLLTRLLFPEAFGLMAVVNSIAAGARMTTDLGVRGSVVQSPRGDDPVFLNTAWTIQILRGFAIAAALLLGAGTLAAAFDKPEAAPLIRVVAFCAAIEGFTSTAALSLMRKVRVGRQTLRDFLSKAIATAVMVTWALVSPSVWALAAGTVAAAVSQLALSHRLIPGYRNALAYERPAARSIVRFGRWVLFATLMTFLLHQGDRLVLGGLMDANALGVYAIAIGLTQSLPEVLQGLSMNILFPVYARLRTLEIAEQRREMERYRFVVLAVALPCLWLLALAGPTLVHALYDARYSEAGWMVQLLATSLVATFVSVSAERALLARGDSFSHMLLQAGQASLVLAGMAAGHFVWGDARGVLIGLVLGRWLGYLPLAILLHRIQLWIPRLDALAFGATLLVLGAGFAWIGFP
jgi:O-antigen/teichoic acid export membrane protein